MVVGHLPVDEILIVDRTVSPFLSFLSAAQAISELRIGTAVVLPLERELFTLAKEGLLSIR